MTDRETLVEILKQAPFEGKVLDEWWWEEKIAKIADYLIAHGVTIQNWIPVTERLPMEYISVIVTIPIEHPLPMVKEAYLANGFWATKTAIFPMEDITHWMPLPKPPKEVDHDS